ncbi:peptidase [Nitrosopumilus sp. b1]|uniref:peptidase n=1 Tax=Nitrosopumilus sp. b1 TaxID=2109907 RepID=UPI0015F534CE|nr:peptidase [Nitrosopumilus sp. b1]
MNSKFVVLLLVAILFAGNIPLHTAFAQFQQGGVNKEGSWYVGEGLKQGDYFSYSFCHVDYEECSPLQIDFWIKGDRTVGSEEKWLAEAVVYDGAFVLKGDMEMGKVAPEPSGGSENLTPYRAAFKSSIAWLSAYATADIGISGKGPREFKAVSWGKIANIGGEQILPTSIETIKVKGGTFETVKLTWKTGGAVNKVWIVDGFPFPVKASTFTHVAEGIPPAEYIFELLSYKENITSDPFTNVKEVLPKKAKEGCSKNYELTSIKKPSKDFKYLVEIKYGPKNPATGCSIEWFISFKNKFNQEEFLNQVQYDILVVDDNLKPKRSIAQEEGKNFLYSASGQVRTFTIVDESPGTARYVIWIYGTSPDYIVPPLDELDYLPIDITISGEQTISPPKTTVQIPDWIKNNAKWWADGQIDDNSFVQGIQFLIKEGIMKIPSTTQGSGSDSNEIPSWIRNNAGWWADGAITDNDFVQGIQFLIQNGIMRIS